MSSSFAFPKSEKLCGKTRIAQLYAAGKRFVRFPLRVTYMVVEGDDVVPQVLIWVPKREFKHAVDRNHLRRQLREAYRLHALVLKQACADKGVGMQLSLVYMASEELDYAVIEKAMLKALTSLAQIVSDYKKIKDSSEE